MSFEILVVVLLILWLGGFVFVPAAGNAVHLLLVILLVLVAFRFVNSRGA